VPKNSPQLACNDAPETATRAAASGCDRSDKPIPRHPPLRRFPRPSSCRDAAKRGEHDHFSARTFARTAAVFMAMLFIAAMAPALCADTTPQTETIELEAGQTRVIDHLKRGSSPIVHVVENAHAVVLHDEVPGQVVILGAERGRWDIGVTRDDGSQVTYG